MTILHYIALYCIVSGIAASAFLWLGNKALESNDTFEAHTMMQYINEHKIIFFLVSFICWPLFLLKGLFLFLTR